MLEVSDQLLLIDNRVPEVRPPEAADVAQPAAASMYRIGRHGRLRAPEQCCA